MNEGDVKALQILVAGLAGALLQRFARAPQNVPMWAFYGGIGVSMVGLYIWATPDVLASFQTNWRLGLMGAVSWYLMVRGGGATAKDVKLAPAANSK